MGSSIQQFVRKNIQNLAPYSSAREEYTGTEGVFLDANENPFGGLNRYPDPYQRELKQKIAALKQFDANQIFLGNGSDEIIDLAFRIFCEPGIDKALTFSPTYGMYEVAANINAVDLIKIPLNDDFNIDGKTIDKALMHENVKLIFICSPNNPTGNLLDVTAVESILDRFKGIVFIDEAYIDFSKQPSFLKKIAEYPNLVVCQTLSKAWGLAGVRLGIAYMSREIMAYYNKVKAPYNISAVNQEQALKALNIEVEYLENVRLILKEKERLIQALQPLKIIRTIFPSDANFLLVEVEDANNLYNRLLTKQIIIRNRHSVLKNCVRITVGTTAENNQLITALKEISNG